MKWGHSYEADTPHQRLLIWVLECVVFPHGAPLDRWLKEILKPGGGLGGDPGWEIDQISSPNNEVTFQVWADPDISGIQPPEDFYSKKEVLNALEETLIALSEAHPETRKEVEDMLSRYALRSFVREIRQPSTAFPFGVQE